MTTAQHTPGPWIYGVRKDGSIWLSIGNRSTGTHYQGDIVCSEADALLMTTAPELLASLQKVMTWIDNWSPEFTQDDEWFGDEHVIRAAIAKATGGAA